MSRQVAQDPSKWSADDVLYLAQFDQRRDEVAEAAQRLGITDQLPQPTGNGVTKAGVATPGEPCPTCGQVVPEPDATNGEDVVPESYGDWSKSELEEEINARNENRGPENHIAVSGNKDELVARLEADDASEG